MWEKEFTLRLDILSPIHCIVYRKDLLYGISEEFCLKVAALSNPPNKGFYWTGDILSTALALEYGQEGTCGVRIFADLTGLFSVTLRNLSKLTLAPLLLSGRSLVPGARV